MDPEERESLGRIRLVAVDLDGTLVRRSGSASLFTRSMVRRAARSGVAVVLATGRTSSGATHLARWLGLRDPVICANGAHVVSGAPRKDWQVIPVPAEVWPGLIGVLRRFQVYFEAHIPGTSVIESRFITEFRGGPSSLREAILERLGARPRAKVRVLGNGTVEKLAGQAVKVFAGAPSGAVREIIAAAEAAFPGRLRYVTTITSKGGGFLEIQEASVNKGQALSLVAERLGIAMEETAAIGDGDNDVEMLKAAGTGVAMANGSPKLVMAADRFTFSCENDGAAYFLRDVAEARGSSHRIDRLEDGVPPPPAKQAKAPNGHALQVVAFRQRYPGP